MRRWLIRIAVTLVGAMVLGCAPAQDGGVAVVTSFFGDLEGHQFEAAADLVRDADGAPLVGSTRQDYVRGWQKAYEGYDIHFTKVMLQRVADAPTDRVRRAGALEGHVYDVKFEGRSNSPCVPVNPSVIPGTTQPIALKGTDGKWFLLADGIVGFVNTCPGA